MQLSHLESPDVRLSEVTTFAGRDYSASIRRGLIRFAPLPLFLLLLGAFSFWLFTRNNDGPYWFHPDEEGKARQIINGTRNFNHPQLLLETVQWWSELAHTPPDVQKVTEVGRKASAMFGAITVMSLALAGYIACRWTGALVAGAAIALCPSLLIHAHYMKEDTALLAGVGAVVAAAAMFWRYARLAPRIVTLLLFAFAAALPPSGKYVGVITLAFAIPILALAPRTHRIRWWLEYPIRFIVFAAVFAGSIALINHRAIDQYLRFRKALDMETDHALNGHLGVSMHQPNGFIAFATWQESFAHVLTFAALFVPAVVATWIVARRRDRAAWFNPNGWLVLAFGYAIAWFIMLSYGTAPFNRYALPVVVLTYWLAAIGAALFVNLLPARNPLLRPLITGATALLFIALQTHACRDLTHRFADDGRQHLRAWLAEHVEPGTAVVMDRYTLLDRPPDPRSPIGQERLGLRLYGAGSLDSLHRTRARYVIVASASYDRYLTSFTHAAEGYEDRFKRTRDFYQTVFADYPLRWQWKPARDSGSFVDPELRVYEVPPVSPMTR